MLDRSHNSDENHGLDLVAYMYGELDSRASEAFESHLENCDECAVELGAFADARLGVIEWRRNDFEHLATPAIIIPETERVTPVRRIEKIGVFAGFLESISSLSAYASAGFALAAAAVLAAIMFFWVVPSGSKREVANSTASAPASEVQPKSVSPAPYQPDQISIASNSGKTDRMPTAARVAERKLPSAKRTVPASQVAVVRSTSRTVRKLGSEEAQNNVKSSPRLNSYDDDEDTTLRLSDLFSQIGPRKK